MPSLSDVIICAVAALATSTCVGLPLALWLIAERGLAWAMAPALGWAAFSALALPILNATGFSQIPVIALCGVAVAGGGLFCRRGLAPADGGPATPIWTYAAAMALAILPTLGVCPKIVEGGLVLADPMFDHSKIAIIDDIVRLGLPPGNPFFGGAEATPGLAYYYLWHFSAAVLAKLAGASGWAADIGLTWFTAFASLSLMMGLAVRFSGRRLAAPIVLLLCLAGSLGPLLHLVFTADFLDRALSQTQAPQSWIFQATWTPQHLASASCVVLAALMLTCLRWRLVPLFAVVAAAGFESSAWVGGIVFAAGTLTIGVGLLFAADGNRKRVDLILQVAAAALLAATIAYPFLREEYVATAARHLGLPLTLRPFSVLGPVLADNVRHLLDVPAYWIILLVIAFPAIYLTGAGAMFGALRHRQQMLASRPLVVGLIVLALVSFGIASLFAATIANNDLGWRGVLPGVLVLTIFAAAGLSRWLTAAPARAMAAIGLLALGIPGGLAVVADNALGNRLPSAVALAGTPDLWKAMRRHTAPAERLASDPSLFYDTVQWPVNISWALFADRRSCFAGWNLARAFVPLPGAELDRLQKLFDRVFAGKGSSQDVEEIATRYDCRVVVLTPQDGAWNRDPFADNPRFRLVEEQAGKWRIYRVVDASPGGR
jgi:hypothetical protein